MNLRHKLPALTLLIGLSAAAGGCARNVDQVDFNKWGSSFNSNNGSGDRIDTSAQGGASQNGVTPTSTNFAVPKASVGGAYHRTTSTSPTYRMTGGFHTR